MTPQFVDLNADGFRDLVMATFMGEVFVVEGSKKGYAQPRNILDKDGDKVRISLYWDDDASDYKSVDRSVKGEPANPDDHCTSVALVDWDADGDLDLLLGAYEGGLYLCKNEGDKSTPKFATKHTQVRAEGRPIVIGDGLATPRVCDWDGDGKFDILCGTVSGSVLFYRNVGIDSQPKFAAAEALIGSVQADSGDRYDMEAMTVPAVGGEPAWPRKSFHIDAVDYDGDGDLDLLLGGSSILIPNKKDLTGEQKAELKTAKDKLEKLTEQLMELTEGIKTREEAEKLQETEEFQALQKQVMPLYEQIGELEPEMNSVDRIWLYRNIQDDRVSPKKLASTTKTMPVKPAASPRPTTGKTLALSKARLSISASVNSAQVKPGDVVELELEIQIPEGCHIYGSADGTFPTEIEIPKIAGLQAATTMVVPKGEAVKAQGKTSHQLHGTVRVTHSFKVRKKFRTTDIQGKVTFMLCNKTGCRPPKTETFKVKVTRAATE